MAVLILQSGKINGLLQARFIIWWNEPVLFLDYKFHFNEEL